MKFVLLVAGALVIGILGATGIALRNGKKLQLVGHKATCRDCSNVWNFSMHDGPVLSKIKRSKFYPLLWLLGIPFPARPMYFILGFPKIASVRCPRCGSNNIAIERPLDLDDR